MAAVALAVEPRRARGTSASGWRHQVDTSSGSTTAASAARIAQLCAGCVADTGVDGAGVSLVTEQGHRGTVHSTDDVAALIEELQFTLGEGPCVDAANSRSPVLLDDLNHRSVSADGRWPGFLEGAASAGVRATFAFPVRLGAIALGAVDLYRMTPGGLTTDQLEKALLATDAMALALLDLATSSDDFDDKGPLRSAYRLQVHAAAGMVSVQLGVPIEAALTQLRAAAYGQDRSVNDLADDVIAGRLRFPQEER